jgi:hypothetical protein
MRNLATSSSNSAAQGISPSLSERLHYIENDKRGLQRAVPIDAERYLNEMQMLALQSLEGFGWQLAFIRRPLFMAPLVMAQNSNATQFALLEEDGSVNLKPDIVFRC